MSLCLAQVLLSTAYFQWVSMVCQEFKLYQIQMAARPCPKAVPTIERKSGWKPCPTSSMYIPCLTHALPGLPNRASSCPCSLLLAGAESSWAKSRHGLMASPRGWTHQKHQLLMESQNHPLGLSSFLHWQLPMLLLLQASYPRLTHHFLL